LFERPFTKKNDSFGEGALNAANTRDKEDNRGGFEHVQFNKGAIKKQISMSEASPPAAPTSGKNILVIGSLNADIIVEINRFPKTGETINARSDSTGFMVPGGKGANQAVASARLGSSGVETQFSCIFGNDSHATTLKDSLVASGVNIDHCSSCDKPSGQAFIFLEENGSNSIIIVGGSNKVLCRNILH
jgi:hypothetical protein